MNKYEKVLNKYENMIKEGKWVVKKDIRTGKNLPATDRTTGEAYTYAVKEIVQAEIFLKNAKGFMDKSRMNRELKKALKHLNAAIVYASKLD